MQSCANFEYDSVVNSLGFPHTKVFTFSEYFEEITDYNIASDNTYSFSLPMLTFGETYTAYITAKAYVSETKQVRNALMLEFNEFPEEHLVHR